MTSMDLPRKILAAAFDAIAEFASEVSDLLDPDGKQEADDDCRDCDHHPRLMSFADVIAHSALARDQDAPDAPSVAQYAWRGGWASEIKQGDVIALDGRHFGGPAGRRALRITDRRVRDQGDGHASVSLLFEDIDSEKPDSIGMGQDAAVQIAIQVPADLGDLGGGA